MAARRELNQGSGNGKLAVPEGEGVAWVVCGHRESSTEP